MKDIICCTATSHRTSSHTLDCFVNSCCYLPERYVSTGYPQGPCRSKGVYCVSCCQNGHQHDVLVTMSGPTHAPSVFLLRQAKYYSKQSYNLGNLEPVVAKPHSPDNKALAKDCRDTKIDRVYIGSCTGGKTEDFAAAARILQNEKATCCMGPTS